MNSIINITCFKIVLIFLFTCCKILFAQEDIHSLVTIKPYDDSLKIVKLVKLCKPNPLLKDSLLIYSKTMQDSSIFLTTALVLSNCDSVQANFDYIKTSKLLKPKEKTIFMVLISSYIGLNKNLVKKTHYVFPIKVFEILINGIPFKDFNWVKYAGGVHKMNLSDISLILFQYFAGGIDVINIESKTKVIIISKIRKSKFSTLTLQKMYTKWYSKYKNKMVWDKENNWFTLKNDSIKVK
jgi:hypothetical protein